MKDTLHCKVEYVHEVRGSILTLHGKIPMSCVMDPKINMLWLISLYPVDRLSLLPLTGKGIKPTTWFDKTSPDMCFEFLFGVRWDECTGLCCHVSYRSSGRKPWAMVYAS